jgi:hypothetical protein
MHLGFECGKIIKASDGFLLEKKGNTHWYIRAAV